MRDFTHPISAIKVAAEQIGFQAAAILDEWMTSRCVPKKNIVIPPLEVVTRQSTDTLAVKDRALAKALNFIREKPASQFKLTRLPRIPEFQGEPWNAVFPKY